MQGGAAAGLYVRKLKENNARLTERKEKNTP
jgi:hypothetical protein